MSCQGHSEPTCDAKIKQVIDPAARPQVEVLVKESQSFHFMQRGLDFQEVRSARSAREGGRGVTLDTVRRLQRAVDTAKNCQKLIGADREQRDSIVEEAWPLGVPTNVWLGLDELCKCAIGPLLKYFEIQLNLFWHMCTGGNSKVFVRLLCPPCALWYTPGCPVCRAVLKTIFLFFLVQGSP